MEEPRVKREAGIALGLLLALVLGMWGYPFLVPGYVGYDGDSLFLFYPLLDLAREELFSGRVPLWNPYKFLGVPLLADLMVPLFYPPQFLALLPPQPFGQHLGIVFHALWAAAGAWVAARRCFDVSPWAALFAGLTYAACASMQAHAPHPNQFYAMAWLPWVLAGVWATIREERGWAPTLLLGVALGMQGLAGQPQIMVYSAVVVGLVMAQGLVASPRQFIGRLPALAIAALIALGLAAVHLLPAYELSRYSLRESGSLEFAQSFSLPLENLKTLILPGALGSAGVHYLGEWNFTETAIFLGQPALALGLIGWVRAWRRSETWIVCVGLLVVGLFWALGSSTPVYALLLKAAPPLAQFRAPARAFILVALSVSMLAALGMEGVRGWIESRGERWNGTTLALGALLVLIAAQAGSQAWFRYQVLRPRLTMLEDAVVPGWEQRLTGMIGGEGRVFRQMEEYSYANESVEAVQKRFERMQADVNVLHRISVFDGYDEGMLPKKDYLGFVFGHMRRIYTPEPDTRLLGLMGIRTILTDKPVRGAGLRFVRAEGSVAQIENRDYRGMAFAPEQWPSLDWEGVEEGEFRFDNDPGDGETKSAPDLSQPEVRAKRLEPSRIEVEFRGVESRRVILSEGWMPGWEMVLSEGQRVKGKKLAAFLIEFDVPEASGSGEIVYRPRGFRAGAALSAGTLAVLAIAGSVLAVRRRRGAGS